MTGFVLRQAKTLSQNDKIAAAERARTDVQKGRGIRYTTVHKPAAGSAQKLSSGCIASGQKTADPALFC